MKKKTLSKYNYEGLGFPIELVDVEMIFLDGEWLPKIDVRKVADAVIRLIPFQNERITGNQIHFIRTHFGMSLRKFAVEVVKESHMAVSKWEKFGDKSTNMDANIEIMLRLYIYEKVCVKTTKEKQNFYQKFQKIKDAPLLKKEPEITLKAAQVTYMIDLSGAINVASTTISAFSALASFYVARKIYSLQRSIENEKKARCHI